MTTPVHIRAEEAADHPSVLSGEASLRYMVNRMVRDAFEAALLPKTVTMLWGAWEPFPGGRADRGALGLLPQDTVTLMARSGRRLANYGGLALDPKRLASTARSACRRATDRLASVLWDCNAFSAKLMDAEVTAERVLLSGFIWRGGEGGAGHFSSYSVAINVRRQPPEAVPLWFLDAAYVVDRRPVTVQEFRRRVRLPGEAPRA